MVRKKNVVARAARAAIESLEERRLLSANLVLLNNSGLPTNNRLVFNYIQNPNTTTPNVERSEETLTLENTGNSNLVLTSAPKLSGPFAFVGGAPAAGTTIAANGGTLAVTIQFTQNSLPAHSVNETNYSNNPNGGAAISGSLSITSNDPNNPTQTVALAGYWQSQSENNAEPGLNVIVNTLFGYSTNLGSAGDYPGTSTVDNDLPNGSTTPVYYGQEVYSPTWQVANASQPATLTEIATFHTQGNNVSVNYVTGSESSPVTHSLFTENGVEGQTLLPSPSYSGTVITGAPYSANIPASAGAFGLRVDNEYSDNQINVNNGNSTGGGHHFRFYPLLDASGNVVPNTYIVAMDYAIIQSENSDFQDNVFLLTNVTPTSNAVPSSPTGLSATSAANPTLTWTGVSATNLAGYNVYRATSPSGPFTKLTATPVTGTTYIDTNSPPAGVTLYYQVTAVSTAAAPNESAPATTTANTPTGPVAGSFAVTAYRGQTVSIDVLSHSSDSTSGATIKANSVAVFNVPAGDTAAVDPTTGIITYTVRSGFSGQSETFNYTVSDGSQTSPQGTVTLNVVDPTVGSPSINAYTAEVLGSGTSTTATPIPVLSNDVSSGNSGFNTGSLTVPGSGAGSPSHGTVTIGTGEQAGDILYTPAVGFVGSDSFKYTVTDNNGQSGSATVTVYVGAEVSTAAGVRAITYTDSGGTAVTARLNLGTADLFFSGSGTIPGAVGRGGVLALGGQMGLADLQLSGTTAASTFTLAGARNGAMGLGSVTDSSALGVLNAPTANVDGVIGLYGGFRTLHVATITDSSINVGPVGNNSVQGAAVQNDTLTVTGAVKNSSLNDAVVALNTVHAASWTNTEQDVLGSISAPSIRSLVVLGQFDPSVSLTGTLLTANIRGAVTTGSWNLQGGANTISLGSVAAGWGGLTSSGNVRTFAVRAGGFSSSLSIAGTLTTFNDNGGLTGAITAANAGTVHVIGNLNTATLDFTGAGTSLRTLNVSGTVLDSTVQTTANLNTFVATSMNGSTVLVGTTGTPTVPSATSANIGAATLTTLSLRAKTGTFADSTVIASTITTASLGSVNNSNGGHVFGVAVKTVRKAITDRESGTVVRVTPVSTTHTFGDFQIRIVTA